MKECNFIILCSIVIQCFVILIVVCLTLHCKKSIIAHGEGQNQTSNWLKCDFEISNNWNGTGIDSHHRLDIYQHLGLTHTLKNAFEYLFGIQSGGCIQFYRPVHIGQTFCMSFAVYADQGL